MMGWSGGTELFDRVMNVLEATLSFNYDGVDDCADQYAEVIDAFRDQDWDNLCESEYYDHPVIGPLLKIDEEDEDEC
jgi:hypothetical protein